MSRQTGSSGDRDPSPDQVISWLRSEDGQSWSARRNTELEIHYADSGMFAEVLPDGSVCSEAAWPEPADAWVLEEYGRCGGC